METVVASPAGSCSDRLKVHGSHDSLFFLSSLQETVASVDFGRIDAHGRASLDACGQDVTMGWMQWPLLFFPSKELTGDLEVLPVCCICASTLSLSLSLSLSQELGRQD